MGKVNDVLQRFRGMGEGGMIARHDAYKAGSALSVPRCLWSNCATP